ncbi:MAG TPA: hypothetical protein VGO08_11595, partial [Burkholderiales bacterium]|nr:hypothetical protein [Burkholderiales bacterium]
MADVRDDFAVAISTVADEYMGLMHASRSDIGKAISGPLTSPMNLIAAALTSDPALLETVSDK